MKLFVDTADVKELETCLERGFPSGVTTNPLLVARSGCTDFGAHIRSMIDALIRHDAKIPLSVDPSSIASTSRMRSPSTPRLAEPALRRRGEAVKNPLRAETDGSVANPLRPAPKLRRGTLR